MNVAEVLRDWSTPTEEDVAAVQNMRSGIKGMFFFRFLLGGVIFAISLSFLALFLFTLDLKYLLLFPLLLVYGGRRFFQLIKFVRAHRLVTSA